MEEYAGMGTTIVCALVAGGRLAVGHVGDSRLYLCSDGGLRQLTHDDSWMARVLAEEPDTDPSLLRHHPMCHALTNVVGGRAATEVHVVEEQLAGGEVLLLSTDGVHGVLDGRTLDRLLREETVPLSDLAQRIVGTALARGSRDNCTAVVARYSQG
jgi:protein phosphatase